MSPAKSSTLPRRIGFVTYHKQPAITADDALVRPHLQRRQIEAVPVVWDDTEIDWRQFAGVILRSCWDYQDRPDEFKAWVDRLEALNVPLWNPPQIVRWNLDKRYLIELAAKGVTIPKTVWLKRGTAPELRSLLRANNFTQAVIKPTISATAKQTWLTSVEWAAREQARFAAQARAGDVMAQSFLSEIAERGEWSLLFFGGRYSHAVLKLPQPGDFRVQTDFGGTARAQAPEPELLAQAQTIAHLIDTPLLYARVDGLYLDGRFTLLELELIEPELFLRLDREAPARFAQAIATML